MEPVESTPIETTAEPSVAAPPAAATTTEPTITHRKIAEWHGCELVDRDGERIGRLEDVYTPLDTESGRRLARR
jgi:hypothetical protein